MFYLFTWAEYEARGAFDDLVAHAPTFDAVWEQVARQESHHVMEIWRLLPDGSQVFIARKAAYEQPWVDMQYQPFDPRPYMDADHRSRLESLAGEYVQLVDTMRSGGYGGHDEHYALDGTRLITHDALIALTGQCRPVDMYQYCKNLLATRRT